MAGLDAPHVGPPTDRPQHRDHTPRHDTTHDLDVRRTGEVAVIADDPVAAGFALVGVHAVAARTYSEVHTAWATLPDAVLVVVLDRAAARYLADELAQDRRRMTVVVP